MVDLCFGSDGTIGVADGSSGAVACIIRVFGRAHNITGVTSWLSGTGV